MAIENEFQQVYYHEHLSIENKAKQHTGRRQAQEKQSASNLSIHEINKSKMTNFMHDQEVPVTGVVTR